MQHLKDNGGDVGRINTKKFLDGFLMRMNLEQKTKRLLDIFVRNAYTCYIMRPINRKGETMRYGELKYTRDDIVQAYDLREVQEVCYAV